MISAAIVIGLGYGDEGKGRTVDYLCFHNPNSIVVRFSGGQQAGHTVMTEDFSHTFSNFGSGSYRGCETYFTEHTTISPININKEREVLVSKGIDPVLIIHPLANVTTPFDVIANRTNEDNLAHGTCGQGVGMTMKRNLESPYKLYAVDLEDTYILKSKLEAIAYEYYGLYDDTERVNKLISDFINEIKKLTNCRIAGYSYLANKDLVFEGSQGILLDMDHGAFPNVTFSNTTSKNALQVCKVLNIPNVEIYGVTRTYHTRHGNGPFHDKPIELKNNEGEINIFNNYQKNFKTAMLDIKLLSHAINIERSYSDKNITLVVTCADQYNIHPSNFNIKGVKNVIYFDSPFNKKSNYKESHRHGNL